MDRKILRAAGGMSEAAAGNGPATGPRIKHLLAWAQHAVREAGTTNVTFCYPGRKEYGNSEGSQAERLQELERENARLKKLVADLSLEQAILTDVVAGNS